MRLYKGIFILLFHVYIYFLKLVTLVTLIFKPSNHAILSVTFFGYTWLHWLHFWLHLIKLLYYHVITI